MIVQASFFIAQLLALDILAIQPLVKHTAILARQLTLDLLQPALPALQFIACNNVHSRYQVESSHTLRQSCQQWPAVAARLVEFPA